MDKVAEINGWDLDKSFPGFDAAVNAVNGSRDAIMAGMTKTTKREKVFTMSDTYYDTKVVIATKKATRSLPKLKGRQSVSKTELLPNASSIKQGQVRLQDQDF